MMFGSPALSFIALLCLGCSDAAPGSSFTHDVMIKHRQISSRAVSQSSPATAAFAGLTPAPTVLSSGQTVTTIEPPTTDPTTPAPERIYQGQDAALDHQNPNPVYARPLVLQRRSVSVSDKAQDAAVRPDLISTSDKSQELVCNCSAEGVLEPDECDRDTGQCVCVAGYTGLQCEECEEDHFSNGTIGCLPCGCDSFGAVGPGCDSSGTCVCKTGVYGPKCDDCHPGFFHFSSSGCQPCQCNQHSTYCHPQSGVCMDCQDNTQGPNCEECVPRFYRAPGGAVTGRCVPCPCAGHSSSGTCHLDPKGHPVCDECKSGFTGPTCDTCTDSFYKSGDACRPCDCNGNADAQSAPKICHPEDGHCLHCANHTAGAHCELCASGYTGNALAHNCTLRAVRLLPASTRTPVALHTPSPAPPSSLLFTSSSSTGPSQAPPLQLAPRDPTSSNSTASALAVVSWTQFNVIVLAVIIVLLVVLMGFVGGVYTYREYRNRKLNAPFWTIELKEDNISFSSYHDSIPHAEPGGLLEEEQCAVPVNGQLVIGATTNAYKA
ncbi:multiple epidermal growth factor-like domains protein 9 [Trichomycterus rosablanca]|uniref:multiple epidermal growth factor-like domains protein 9 n=1 Tax=Trichomycterus rosablanca TaxID=2290929 RepID=UPI002F356FE9